MKKSRDQKFFAAIKAATRKAGKLARRNRRVSKIHRRGA